MEVRTSLLAPLAAFALLAAGLNSHAQTWTTILDLENTDLAGFSLLIDPSSASSAPSKLWLGAWLNGIGTLISLDQASGTISEAPFETYEKLGYDPASGDLYSVGRVWRDNQWHWLTTRSSDNGITWTEADFSTSSGGPAGFAADDQGGFYFAGGNVVRKTSDRGRIWTTVRSESTFSANDLCFSAHPSRGLFVVCSRSGRWAILRSRDGGTTWSTVDLWQNGFAKCIASDSQGVLYVGGRSDDAGAWAIRRSTDGGSTWQSIYSPVFDGHVEALAVDALGNLFFAGIMYHQGPVWGIRRRTPEGVVKDLGASDFRVGRLAVDRAGNLLAAGVIRKIAANTMRWIVRRLRFNEVPPLQVSRSAEALVLSWPAWYATNAVLETSTIVAPISAWEGLATSPAEANGQKFMTITPAAQSGFFRLRGP